MKRILLAVTLFLTGITAPYMANACECMPPKLDDLLKSTDAVFIGTVQKKHVIFNTVSSNLIPYAADFRVWKVWKGDISGQVTVKAYEPDGFSCEGTTFEEGKKYLVFANGDSSLEAINFCSPSVDVKYIDSYNMYKNYKDIFGKPKKEFK